MGSRGATLANNDVGAIQTKIAATTRNIERLSTQMKQLAHYAMPGADYDRDMAGEYYDVKREYDTAKATERALRDELRRKKAAETPARKATQRFVNGYGEATRRHITSGSYERAMRRQEREIRNFLGAR